LHFIVPGTTFRFSGISIFHIFTQCAQREALEELGAGGWLESLLVGHICRAAVSGFLVASSLCGLGVASGDPCSGCRMLSEYFLLFIW